MENTILSAFVIAQILALIGIIINLFIWQIKKPKHIIAAYIPVNLLWTIQYALIGGYVGASLSFLSALRDSSFFILNEKYHKFIIFLILVITVFVGSYHYEHLHDLLPVFGAMAFNIGFLLKEKRSLFARGSLLNNFAWFFYCVQIGSVVGALSPLLAATSTVIGMARYENWRIMAVFRSQHIKQASL